MTKLKFAKPKKVLKSKLKRRAWDMFSMYIRLSYVITAANGRFNICYTCDTIKPVSEMQAGHGIPGRNNAVLFMEKLVKPQCVQCNIFKHGNLAIFTRKLIAELGVKEYDKLALEAEQTVQYKTYQYQEIYDKYDKKFKALI